MFERERTLYAFMLKYASGLVADVDDARLVEQPLPGVNHAAWILGHLAISTDYGRQVLGQKRQLPEEWHMLFGPGSTPAADRSVYPSKGELLAALTAGHADVSAASHSVTPETLDRPNPIDWLREPLPTSGDLLAHLMTTHEATHIGQLSTWRRAMGFPSVL